MSEGATPGPQPRPGLVPEDGGARVTVFSAHATRIDVCLFDASGDRETARIPLTERTGDLHHGHVPGLVPGVRYGLRAHGPFDPARGHRFNPEKLLVDPLAEALDRPFVLHPALLAGDGTDTAPLMPKAVVLPSAPPRPPRGLRVPWRDTVIYELNVRAFTMRHPDVPVALRGTFAALKHPAVIAHLTGLGVTTLELMPVASWIDERHLPPLGLTNAWGYNPVAFAAPDPRLAPGGWEEIRDAVSALQQAGFEVLLDVVLNHTGEGDELGPTLSLRGLDNAGYYRLRPDDPASYIDDMGCGNCLALDRPQGVDLALHALRTWVRRAGIDGFRFDLATAMGRRPEGFDPDAPLIRALDEDADFAGLKMIAEAWDIGPGGYQVGRFPREWGEWNDRARDSHRRFWRGDAHRIGDLATRLAGSSDLFSGKAGPARGIGFVTAHDGFTLADLVSHRMKHNTANGEDNRDGTNDNHSWNHGVEGASDDPALLARRRRDQINLLAGLLFSRGTPMLSMGSEMGHSQGGNNNAYAQDNAIGWLNWEAADSALLAATRALIAARRALAPVLAEDRMLTGETDARWLRPDGEPMREEDWNAPDAGTLALLLASPADPAQSRVLLAIHRKHEPVALCLPQTDSGWTRLVDTSRPVADWKSASPATGTVTLGAPSVALFAEVTCRPQGQDRDAAIDRLADEAGIYRDWWDLAGDNHPVTRDSKAAMLTAMGLDVGSAGAARDALEHLAGQRARRRLPLMATGREGQPLSIPLAFAAPGDAPPRHLSLSDEAGRERHVFLGALARSRRETTACDGRLTQITDITLPPLTAGRYILRVAGEETACALTIAPPRAPLHPARGFGLSAQLYTLRRAGDQGIGDFTTLGTMAERTARAGGLTFGINPPHALFPGDRDRASPYHPSDRRFLDPIYIDLAGPLLRDLPGADAPLPNAARLRAEGTVDYSAVSALKGAALRQRFAAMRAAGDHPDFSRFIATGGETLARFAAFRAIEAHHPGVPWQAWPGGLSDAGSPAVRAFAAARAEDVAFAMFEQWIAEGQFAAAADGASSLPLGLYRDLAVGCAPDGAEAWAAGDGFVRGMSVGAPPDPFSAQGQVWNLPPPNPLAMEREGCAAFRSLIAANMRHAGMLRIDHVMGLTRLFWVPEGGRATDGAYVAYPQQRLLAELALESRRAGCVIVGEDLGTVPEGFREALEDSGVLSYRVLWFERDGDRFRAPQTYPEAAVACASTHDLPTLEGWWRAADIDENAGLGLINAEAAATARDARAGERRALIAQLVEAGLLDGAADPDAPLSDAIAAAVHAFIAAAPSRIAFAQVDDLCATVTAVNLPGTDRERPNWRRKLDAPSETVLETTRARAILAALRARG